MRFVDTNEFVRFLTFKPDETDGRFFRAARDVFRSGQESSEQFTTNDAVIAEVIFVLTSPNLYDMSRSDVLIRLGEILREPHCKLDNRVVIFQALALWESNARISFVDALCLATSQHQQYDLVTFDTALAKVANVVRWDLRT